MRADDPVDLAREPVHEPALEAADSGLPDHARRLREVDVHEPRRAGEERLHRDLDAGREHAADVLALRRDDVEVRRRPKSTTMAGAPYRSRAATAFTIRSGPTSRGSS
jgi:hypothetical protein